jgi:hypothetical protein
MVTRDWMVTELRRRSLALVAAEKDSERYGSLLDRIEAVARDEHLGTAVALHRIVALFDEDERRARELATEE